jgi:hypothetical protein
MYVLGIGMSVAAGCLDSPIAAASTEPSLSDPSLPPPRDACREAPEKRSLLCAVDPFMPRCKDDAEVPEPPGTAEETEDIPPEEDIVPSSVPIAPRPAPAAVPDRVKRPAAIPDAPMPYIYKMKDGRRVCSTKHDNPGKSRKNKKTHMDMECCLDPDETPNPHCHYPEEKYGKYLKKFR